MTDHQFTFPEHAVKAFTEGDCGYLAMVLSLITGFTAVTASIDDESSWTHAGVLTPDGRVLDIQGLWTVETWLDKWLDGLEGEEHYLNKWEPIPFMGTVRMFPREFPRVSPEEWAKTLLAEYEKVR